jgi:hypothetical protein
VRRPRGRVDVHPTNASWLNWIECEFTALRYFTLDGSDYPSHAAQDSAIAGYVRWANKHATPKRRLSNRQDLWMKIFRRLRVEGSRRVVRRACR